VPERKAFGRRKDNSKFYNSYKWRKFATAFRLRNPFCKECDKRGEVGPAEVCDHIRGLDFLLDNKLNAMSDDECQSLCHKCHNSKSGRESHGIRQKKEK